MKLKSTVESTLEPLGQSEQEEQSYSARKKSISQSLQLTLDMYTEQYNSIVQRIDKRKTEMISAIIVFVITLLVDGFFTFLLNDSGGKILASSWEMWAVCIAIYIFMWKSGFRMVECIFEYNIQNETVSFQKYKEKYNVYTLRDEQRYCRQKMDETKKMLVELSDMAYPASLTLYEEFNYVGRRADSYTFDLFRNHQIICYIIMGILFVIFCI